MEERWKPIKGYEGLYDVSSFGNVKSLLKRKVLKPQPNSSGYLRIQLTDKNGAKKRMFIHRLVADAFLPHSEGNNIVNHKDFNPRNNNMENLEWTTDQGNVDYSTNKGRYKKRKEWLDKILDSNEKYTKAVVGLNIENGEKIMFNHLNDVKKYGFQPSCVCNCCKGKRKTHKGYYWRYKEQTWGGD